MCRSACPENARRPGRFLRLAGAIVLPALGATAIAAAARADSAPPGAWPLALRHVMQRTADVEWRLQTAAGGSCPALISASGLVLDSLDAYAPADRTLVSDSLGVTDRVYVAAVAAGSPAQRAGIEPGDGIAAIDGSDIAAIVAGPAGHRRETEALRAMAALERLPAGSPVPLVIHRHDATVTLALVEQTLCASHIYISTQDAMRGYSDGVDIVITASLVDFTRSDDELALLAGHELGHAIARDGKVSSVAVRRRMEDRADLVGADLAACAGYDTRAAAEFWQRWSESMPSSVETPPRTHASGAERTARILAHPAPAACPVTGAPGLKDGS